MSVFLPPEMAGEVSAMLGRVLEQGALKRDLVNVSADGRRTVVRIAAEVVPGEDGAPAWIVTEVQDLTDLLGQLQRLSATALSLAGNAADDLLSTILKAARTLTGARYAALGLVGDDRRLVRFIPDGMTDEAVAGIDHWPEGLGLLGAMISEHRTINVPEIAADPRSSGFPPGHPPMTSFLGVPIVAGDLTLGHLYLTDKAGAPAFGPVDERLAELFAAHAAVAIREHRQAEELSTTLDALRASEGGLRFQAAILDQITDAVIVTGLDGRIVHWNRGAEAVFGYTSDEMLGQTPALLYPAVDPAAMVVALDAILAGRDFAADRLGRRRDGSPVWTSNSVTVMRDEDGEPMGFVGVSHDITARKRAEAERDRLTAALGQTGDAVMITDPSGVIAYVNAAFERLTGYAPKEVIGRSARLLDSGQHSPGHYEEIARTTAGGGTWSGSLVDRRKDGSLVEVASVISPIVHDDGAQVGRVEVARDTTRERQLEAQLRQAPKMEAVGRLAGGVAHDFNNLLTAILGHARFLQEDAGLDAAHLADAAAIEQAAERAASLTRQLLTFSRRQVVRPTVLDVNAVVDGIMPMVGRLLGEDIAVRVQRGGGLDRVRMDGGQLEQVIVNLAVNARDAMPDGGTLAIETAQVAIDEAYARTHPGAWAGPAVRLTVSDTGRGMDEATRERIFEPFFTTKELGRGTGLGLATVYAIVQQTGGHILVDSEPGRGATFSIYLPGVSDEPTAGPMPPALDDAQRGTERILLVEDEPSVRAFALRVLGELGYTVLAASGAEEAFALLERSSERVALLVTDVVLPGMRGVEIADRLDAADPSLKVLFISGYPEEEAILRGVTADSERFLQKPFGAADLARRVRAILDA